MLFITYWELNPDFDPSELADLAQTFLTKKLFPAEGLEIIGWYVTPEYWGISISKADSEEAVMREATGWRIAKPGIFTSFRISPAMEVAQVLPLVTQLKNRIKG